jgi:TolB-like protein
MEERDMKLKASILVLAFACLSAAAAAAAPKVAVLDAVLPEKMDINVAIGVTEKISEELVGSGRFTVLDRTTVGQSLKEIEFQMSGMVSDEQIKKAGEQLNSRLGAAYVVVSRVSVVGETYFVTAKMIDIKTGEITAQASSEQEGKVAITLKIAQAVGKKLAGGVKEPAAVVTTELAEEKQPVKEAAVEKEPERASSARTTPRSRILLSYLVPVLGGDSMDILASYIGSSSLSTMGLLLDWKQMLFKGLYVSALASVTSTTVEWWNTTTLEYVTDPYLTTLDFQAGVGWAFPIGKAFQGSIGIQGGLLSFNLGDFWLLSTMDELSWCATAEVGLDWILFKSFTLGTRLSYTISEFPDGGIFVTADGSPISFDYLGLSLGLGLAY